MQDYHRPVLLSETLALLAPKPGGVFVDATLGGGGHSAEILKRIGPSGTLIGIDRDPEALQYAGMRLRATEGHKVLIQGNFGDFESLLPKEWFGRLDGVLFDLGVSSHQLDAPRGFSFQRDEPLDMRMGVDAVSAADIVNEYSEEDLARILRDYGEERYARRIAGAIIARRAKSPFKTTGELAEVIVSAIPGRGRWQDIHPATRSFQGIRIETNRELEAIEKAVPVAIDALKVGGVVAVISFHSLEDRIIKTIFRRLSGKCECPPRLPRCECGAREIVRILTRKPITPSAEEIENNPRSRSSKLRAAVKIG